MKYSFPLFRRNPNVAPRMGVLHIYTNRPVSWTGEISQISAITGPRSCILQSVDSVGMPSRSTDTISLFTFFFTKVGPLFRIRSLKLSLIISIINSSEAFLHNWSKVSQILSFLLILSSLSSLLLRPLLDLLASPLHRLFSLFKSNFTYFRYLSFYPFSLHCFSTSSYLFLL